MMWHRVLLAGGNIFFSLVLGAVALAFVGINFPETLDGIVSVATSVKAQVTNTGLAPRYNVWVRLLLEEKQLVFIFFTIVTRIAIAILASLVTGLFAREA